MGSMTMDKDEADKWDKDIRAQVVLMTQAVSLGERKRIITLLREYLVTKWNPPHVINLWRAGEREVVERIIEKIQSLDFLDWQQRQA